MPSDFHVLPEPRHNQATRLLHAGLALGIGVAWSRIYLGAHFPLDMIGAFGVAVVATLLVRMAGPFLRRSVYPKLISVYEILLSGLALPRTVFPRNR